MKKGFFAVAFLAVAVACSNEPAEAPADVMVDTVGAVDSNALEEVVAEGEEAAAE